MAIDRFLETAFSLSKPDWTMGQTKDMADMFRRFYNMGLDQAAQACDSLAEQSCGGSGAGGETYKVAARHIRTMFAGSQ